MPSLESPLERKASTAAARREDDDGGDGDAGSDGLADNGGGGGASSNSDSFEVQDEGWTLIALRGGAKGRVKEEASAQGSINGLPLFYVVQNTTILLGIRGPLKWRIF